ncbi:glycoside hydrolase family 57 protein [Candidatus Saccharibacteria bacterium]|nr:glycoside hydrolase family 57 protein [Candidatus Saccharibacteria bacterium]
MHQPWRFERYSIFDISHDHNYWDEIDYYDKQNNERIFRKVAEKSYYPMLNVLDGLIQDLPDFKISLSITGTWLDQAELWEPELVKMLQKMVKTGQVEIVAETYYHSLAFFYNRDEFEVQVKKHLEKIRDTFGVVPKVFRNTELAYNDEVGRWADAAGFKGVLAEGWDKILGWKSPNYVYRPYGAKQTKLLLKNYRLSDDIAFRFSDRTWTEWPLTVEKYMDWVDMDCLRGPLINLFMDFETFGEHQWAETGIFQFFEMFVRKWLAVYDNHFVTVSEACDLMPVADEISMPETVTWADTERDLSAWMHNEMQQEALRDLYEMRTRVIESGDERLIEDFRRLSTSDHAYYMCTKYWNDGDVHAYFSAYDSPFDAFMYYMNVLRDMEWRLSRKRA